jgi:hypothetical protein
MGLAFFTIFCLMVRAPQHENMTYHLLVKILTIKGD